MQIKQTKKEELRCEFIVTLSADEIDGKINERLKEVGETVSMPGFRPGKVPLTVLKSKYGQAIMGEVLEKAVNDSTMEAINENKLRPAMQPKIEVKSFEEGKGLEYTMVVELIPEIKVTDFSKIKLEKLTAKPEKDAIKESIDRIADSQKKMETVKEKRASKKGDVVLIDFDGSVDGERKEGMKGEGYSLELGSNSFVGTFEDQLVGKKAGDHVTVTVTFPEDYGSADLAGKEAVFEVDIKELQKAVKAKLDDDLAKTMGFEDLKGLEAAVVTQMQSEYDRHSRMLLKKELLDVLDEKHTFKIPEGMVNAEFDAILHQVTGHQHAPGEECDHDHGVSESDKKEYREIASRRVKLGLVLAEVGKSNNIEVTQQELQQAVIAEAQRYPGQESQVFEYYQKNEKALEMLRAPVFEDKIIDFVLEMTQNADRQVTFEELSKAAEGETPKSSKSSGKKTKKSSDDKKTSSKKATAKKGTTKKDSSKK